MDLSSAILIIGFAALFAALLLLIIGLVYSELMNSHIPRGISNRGKRHIVHGLFVGIAIMGRILERLGICHQARFTRWLSGWFLTINNPVPPGLCVKNLVFSGVPVRVYEPTTASDSLRRGLVYFHGGGWVLGSLGAFDTLCSMSKVDKKWTQPGWRIEMKYANSVLVGNWAEERLQFTRELVSANSTSRTDYRPHWDFKPDIAVRLEALRKAEGPSSREFFDHHGMPTSNCLVSLYDESYARKHNIRVPTRRPWHPDCRTWQAEKSDYPILDPPTNFGLLESKKRGSENLPSHLSNLSVYRSVFQKHPRDTFCQERFARTPRALSSHLHAANHNNKDLDLRQRSLFQVPDHFSGLLPSLIQF